jgi:uncharacterized protein YraI
MKTLLLTTAVITTAVFAGIGSATAATSATANVDLNIRSGPGPQYPPVGVIAGGDSVTVDGCIQGSQWCQVSHNGTTGWSYGQYLTTTYQGQTVIIEKQPEVVPTITYQAPANAPAPAPVAGQLIGPADTTDLTIAPPPAPVQTYIQQNPVKTVYLNGEVVVGAAVPETVQLDPVPDYSYDYVYVNGQPVLVDPQSRRIVYVYR